MIVASGTAVSQSREAIESARQEGLDVGLVKLKSLRPFPTEELKAVTANAKAVIVPEFNRVGWLAREVRVALEAKVKVVGGPRVFGGMTMPPDMILDEIRRCANE